ncbi:hypothetical protein E2F48_11445 [Arthrobacter crusticola]|uniref:Uncharacterized protein n=1 Tax=Arthrobacter crusticola TaxID=2547960 RepID=A0A4R5TXB4_9MICC|nr:hypothetical protein [Arthrobacter crusticola]TDK25831.1 hypothetical protein E2F48_11445 [Arthrobacter crusticola]
MTIAIDAGDPSYAGPDSRSAGLGLIAAIFGAGAGSLAGLLVGVIVWKLDRFLAGRFSSSWRSVIMGALIATFTGVTAAVVFRDLPAGTVIFLGVFGALFALVVSLSYFSWRFRHQR